MRRRFWPAIRPGKWLLLRCQAPLTCLWLIGGCMADQIGEQEGRLKWEQAHDSGSVDTGAATCSGVTVPPGYVCIPGGSFTMGSPTSENCRGSDETQHAVTLSHAFFLKTREVTQSEFESEMGYNPSHFTSCGSSCPVESVSWHEALAYCNKLSQKEGLPACFDCSGSLPDVTCDLSQYATVYDCPGYRLPTEAEWEYAARAGTTTAYYNGDNDVDCRCDPDANLEAIGWYCANSGVSYAGCFDLSEGGGPACAGTHPVAQKQANSWGLYDMSGNVFELCWDRHGDYPAGSVTDPTGGTNPDRVVVRGGTWVYFASRCRSANRGFFAPGDRDHGLGLRPARSIHP